MKVVPYSVFKAGWKSGTGCFSFAEKSSKDFFFPRWLDGNCYGIVWSVGSVEWNILCSPQNAAFLKKDCILCITMYNATFAIEIKRAHLLKIWKWCILNIHHFHILRWTSMSRACFLGAERFGKFQTQICRISHRTKAPTGQTNSDNEQGTLPGTHIYPCFLNMDIGHRRHRYLGKIYVSDLILIFRTPPHFSVFFMFLSKWPRLPVLCDDLVVPENREPLCPGQPFFEQPWPVLWKHRKIMGK